MPLEICCRKLTLFLVKTLNFVSVGNTLLTLIHQLELYFFIAG